MSRRSRLLPQGRYWTKAQLASHFSRSIDWLNKNYNQLLAMGMPNKDAFFDAWDSVAIKFWEDGRSNITNDPVAKDKALYERELANGEI